VLFQEDSCKDCEFQGIKLSHNGTFSSNNSAVIRSAFINSECLLQETAYGYSYYSPPEFPVQNFIPYTLIHNESTNIEVTITNMFMLNF
jgi:hypothetical protein